MNKQYIKDLQEKITEYQNQDLYVEFSSAINYFTIIKNAHLLADNKVLVISDLKDVNITIELHYLSEVEIEDRATKLYMTNDIDITLNY